jgi:hypothetical protein
VPPERSPYKSEGGNDYESPIRLIGGSENHRIRKVTRVALRPTFETYFPHVAVGGGDYATNALSSTGDSPVSGNLILTDQQGGSFVAIALVKYQELLTVIPVISGKAPSIPD